MGSKLFARNNEEANAAASSLSFRTFFLILVLSIFSPQELYGAEQVSTEATILAEWKAKAGQSEVGKQLIGILASTSATISAYPRNKQALYTRGYLFGMVGCTYSAIADLSKAIDLDQNFAQAYTERGICFLDLKNYRQAQDDLNRAIALNPYSADARLARGKLLLELEKPQAAESDFRACQSAYCKFSPVLPGELPANYYNAVDYYLGVCDESMGRLDSALKHFKASAKPRLMGGSGYIKRYSDQPLDASYRASRLELGL